MVRPYREMQTISQHVAEVSAQHPNEIFGQNAITLSTFQWHFNAGNQHVSRKLDPCQRYVDDENSMVSVTFQQHEIRQQLWILSAIPVSNAMVRWSNLDKTHNSKRGPTPRCWLWNRHQRYTAERNTIVPARKSASQNHHSASYLEVSI